MRIMITGGMGFIGSNLSKWFAGQNHHVIVFDNFKRDRIDRNLVALEKFPNVDIYRGDVRFEFDFNELPVPDVILHFAGNAGIPWSIQNPASDFFENVIGTHNVLQYAKKTDAGVIMASTNRVYPTNTGWPLVEEKFRYKPLRNYQWAQGVSEDYPMTGPKSPYGASKAAADILVQEWWYTFGVRTIVNRMGVIYGEGQWGVTEQGWLGFFCRMQKLDKPVTIYGNGKQVRDPLYITDLCRLIQLEIENLDKLAGEVFNVGGGIENSASLLEIVDYLGLKTTPFEAERFADMKWYVTNYQKVFNAIGWEPEVKLSTGINQTLNWLSHAENIE